ncbi:MAG: response regulator [Magnetococcales bacterium]|nr:response regulator [Magnetococcales bacterium]
MEKNTSRIDPPAILVVDDQRANLIAMRRLLKDLPATVMEAMSGDEALRLCLNARFALALIDVQMPGMDGFELAEFLRGTEHTREMPLLFVSATLTQMPHALQGYQAGALDYLQKPVDNRILLSKVKVLLDLHQAREELRLHRDHLAILVAERTASLEEARAELRALNRHVEQAREQERRRIARALHDEMGNTLAQQKMTLEWLLDNPHDPDRIHRELERLKGQVEESIAKARHITLMLRPPVLDHGDLPEILEWQAAEFEKASGIHCRLEAAPMEAPLDENHKLALFRILQESLTNVGRHAGASEVAIALDRLERRVQLTIQDNGSGIADEILLDPRRCLGLRGMEERACQNGGELHVETSAAGTRVTASLPLGDVS